MSDITPIAQMPRLVQEEALAPYLVKKIGPFSSYRMPVDASNIAIADQVREMHIQHLYNAGYRGYDKAIDQACHQSGVYLFVCRDSRIVLTTRVNYRSTQLFPFEMGLTDTGEQYQYNSPDLAADINTYSVDLRYIRRSSALMLASLGELLREQGVVRLFCLADQNNLVIRRMYDMTGFHASKDYTQPIHFESFVNEVDGLPTRWCILEMSEQDILSLRDNTPGRKTRAQPAAISA